MPFQHFVLLILGVMSAAGLTVWLISLGGPGVMLAALPLAMIAALAVRRWLK